MPLDLLHRPNKRAPNPRGIFDVVDPSWHGIGARFRRERPGPEAELVRAFLNNFPLIGKRGYRLTLFQEPRLLSGFPDLVAVQWHEPTAMRWTEQRAGISIDDLRIVHVLATTGPIAEDRLESVFRTRVLKNLQRLHSAGLIVNQGGFWRLVSLRRAYAVRRIIAFEAKISDWRSAIEQASLNRWFASETYVLLPSVPQEITLETAKRSQVGIWVLGTAKPLLKSQDTAAHQPVSFASWLFNEWVWRSAKNLKKQGTQR